MKQLLSVATAIILFVQCESRVEIPINHAGIVITDHQVESHVLRPGDHRVFSGSKVVVFDVSYERLETQFEFIFKDVTEGNLKLTIEFTPIADSLRARVQDWGRS